jgi:membrane dipeptidase
MKRTRATESDTPFFCDAHVDTLSKMLDFNRETLADIPSDSHVTASRLRRSAVGVVVFAMFTERYDPSLPPLPRTLRMIDMAYSIARENSDWVEIATDTKSIRRALKSGRKAIVLSIENGISIEGDLGLLRNVHRLGVRLMSLTWNYRNRLGDGVVGSPARRRGLTPLGRETLREMERLGMIVDVSHLSEKTFWDVIEAAERPVVATHSNAFALCPHPRNLTDDQIRAISESGGFIGLNFCPAFLDFSEEVSIRDVVHHARHIAEVGGVEVLAVGSDYDGIYNTPKGLEHIGKIGKLAGALSKAGFSRLEVEAIAHGNFLRVFREVCG